MAASWDEPAGQLARDLAGAAGPGAVVLSVQNASSIPASEVPAIRRALEAKLRALGVRVTSVDLSAPEVVLTLSENIEGYLWVALVRQGRGSETRVFMRALARAPLSDAAVAANSVILRKNLLWSQPLPILDALLLAPEGPGSRLMVLDSEKVTLLRRNTGRWEPVQSLPIGHAQPFPRDLRGRLFLRQGGRFEAYLPGLVCASRPGAPGGTIAGENPMPAPSAELSCRESDDPWPLQQGTEQAAFFGSARNFFTGTLAPAIGKLTETAPFYSAVAVPRPSSVVWLFAGVDGRVRAADAVNELTFQGTRAWGSNLAAVKSACGTMVLADSGGDYTAGDALRAYDLAEREAMPSSPPLEFPGPVTALWNSDGESSATAAIHNLKTGQYEAYSVAIACQ